MAVQLVTICASVLRFPANACVKHNILFFKLDTGLCHIVLSHLEDTCGFIKCMFIKCMFLIVHHAYVLFQMPVS